MLVGGVVGDQVDDHPQAAVVGGAHELDEVAQGAQPGIDPEVVADVVAVVEVGRGVERHQPQAGDAQAGQVVDLVGQAGEVAAAVAVAVHERLDVQAVEDRVLPPQVGGEVDPHGVVGRSFFMLELGAR